MDYTKIKAEYLFAVNDGKKAVKADAVATINADYARKALATSKALYSKAVDTYNAAVDEYNDACNTYSVKAVSEKAVKAYESAAMVVGKAGIDKAAADAAAEKAVEKAARVLSMYEKRADAADAAKQAALEALRKAEREADAAAEKAKKTAAAVTAAAKPLFAAGKNPTTKAFDIARFAFTIGIMPDENPTKKEAKKGLPELARYMPDARTFHCVDRKTGLDAEKSIKTAAREIIVGLYDALRNKELADGSPLFDVMEDGFIMPRIF